MAQAEEVSQAEARELFVGEVKTVPLGRVKIAVATIVARGIKLRVSGGLNVPGYQVATITVVYLFRAR